MSLDDHGASRWTWLRSQTVAADHLVHSEVGPVLSREEAHAYIAAELAATAGTEPLRRMWARGAKDDTVYAQTTTGAVTWAIFEIGDQTPQDAALAWLEDFAATQRAAGFDAQVARPRRAQGPGA